MTQAERDESAALESVRSLHVHALRRLDRHQRLVERATDLLGRPVAIYVVLIVIGAWVGFNGCARWIHLKPFDPPPFAWLQGLVSLAALLATFVVLTTQRREGRYAEQRAFLNLQANLSAEQKAAKLIALIEELRRDLPSVRDRKDTEAEAMAHALDPQQTIETIETLLGSGTEPPRGAR